MKRIIMGTAAAALAATGVTVGLATTSGGEVTLCGLGLNAQVGDQTVTASSIPFTPGFNGTAGSVSGNFGGPDCSTTTTTTTTTMPSTTTTTTAPPSTTTTTAPPSTTTTVPSVVPPTTTPTTAVQPPASQVPPTTVAPGAPTPVPNITAEVQQTTTANPGVTHGNG